jgi:uncharacterized protein YggE
VDEEDVIVVVGVGTATLQPDRVRADVGVTATAPSVGEALGEAGAAQERLVAVLLEAGIDRAAIQTSHYHAGHDHQSRPGSSRQRADMTLTISLPPGTAGDLLSRMSDAVGEPFRVDGVWPASSDTAPARRDARRDAVLAARAQAEELAEAAGVRLGRLRSLIEGIGGGGGHLASGGAMAMRSMPAPGVEEGELVVRVAVTATYEILQ